MEPAPSSDHIVLAFLQRFSQDQLAGDDHDLPHYLALWPGHEEVVAREYLGRTAGGTSPDASSDPVESASSSRTLGPYRLIEEIGRGGQGSVFRAHDPRLGRDVAVKILRASGGSSDAVQRFHREAAVTARLRHPHICTILDVGLDDGAPWIAMPLIDGEPLSRRLASASVASTRIDTAGEGEGIDTNAETRRPSASAKSIRETLVYFEKVARALHAAHEAGVLHRDVKPGNLMIREDGEPMIMDFGLAQSTDDDLPTLTRSGDVLGTPAYMSPEQLAGEALDRRTDVYSLVVSLYEALTFERPFQAPTRAGLIDAIRSGVAAPLRGRGTSRDLSVVVEVGLDRDPDRRFATAQDLADDLARVIRGDPVAARPLGPVVRTWRWSRRHPVAATLVLTAAALLPVIGFFAAQWDTIQRQKQADRAAEAETWLQEGYFGLGERTFAPARDAFERAVAIDSATEVESVAGIALSWIHEEKPAEAVTWLDRHASLERNHAGLVRVRVAALRKGGDDDQADALAQRLGPPDSALDAFLAAASLLPEGVRTTRRDVWERIEHALWTAVVTAPRRRALYHFQYARVVGQLGREQQCRTIARTLRRLWPDSAASWYYQAVALGRVDPAASVAAADEALARRPGYVNAIARKALGLNRLGKHQAAYDLLVSIDSDAFEPSKRSLHLANLGVVLGALGRHDDALDFYRRSVDEDPGSWVRRHDHANALLEAGRARDCLAAIDEAISIAPDIGHCIAVRAHALSALGERAAAIREFERAVAIDAIPDARIELSRLLVHESRLPEAIAHLRVAVRDAPEDPIAWQLLGSGLAQFPSQRHEAILSYRQALALDDTYAVGHYDLGCLLMADDDGAAEATRCFRRASQLRNDHAETWCNLGHALSATGDLKEAANAFERGHALGAGRDGWPYPSDQWLARVRKDRDAEQSLLTWLGNPAGDPAPDALDGALASRRFGAAARLWKRRHDATGDAAHLLSAVACAVQVVDGREAEHAAHWRTTARRWLEQELDDISRRTARRWLKCPDLQRVRPPGVDELPSAERAAWNALWDDVEAKAEGSQPDRP